MHQELIPQFQDLEKKKINYSNLISGENIVNVIVMSSDKSASKTYQLTVELITITFPMVIFTATAFSFVGFLQSYGEFNIPAMISRNIKLSCNFIFVTI